jgi:inosine-uridine nucleoside N-ribohydrolase
MADTPPVEVWIDTDPSIGVPFHDADDGFALVQAFNSPELRIRGISVSYGNASLKRATKITRAMTRLFGSRAGLNEHDVFAGAASAGDIDRPTEATRALERALSGERKLTYVALGPLTNLAAFLKQCPQSVGKIERVVFLGGRQPGERFKMGSWNPYEFHDANFEKDPASAAAVLRSTLPVSLAPATLSKHVLITPSELERIGRDGGGAGRFLRWKADAWLRLWRLCFGLKGGPVFDSMAVLAVSNPEYLTACPARAFLSSQIEGSAPAAEGNLDHRKFLLALPDGDAAPKRDDGRQVILYTAVKPQAKRLILDRLTRRAREFEPMGQIDASPNAP